MLSLVVILCIIGFIAVSFRKKKDMQKSSKWVIIQRSLLFIIAFFITAEICMCMYMNQVEKGYYQEQINTLMRENEKTAEVKEMVQKAFEDDPEFLNFAVKSLDRKIKEKDEKISRYITIQENVPYFRWCLYFG